MLRSRFSTQAARRRRELLPGRGAVELLQQALVVIGVLVAGAAAEARRGRRRPPPARCGWAGACRSVRKTPLWQADTTTTVGRAPQPASSALSSVAGLTVPLRLLQHEAALVAVAGDEGKAGLAAGGAQGARHVRRRGDGQRRIGARIGGQRADVAHAARQELGAHRLDAVVEGRAVVVAGDQHHAPAVGRHRRRPTSIAICCEVRADGGGAAACSGVQARDTEERRQEAL